MVILFKDGGRGKIELLYSPRYFMPLKEDGIDLNMYIPSNPEEKKEILFRMEGGGVGG